MKSLYGLLIGFIVSNFFILIIVCFASFMRLEWQGFQKVYSSNDDAWQTCRVFIFIISSYSVLWINQRSEK